jgi:hypothetical protein
VLLATSASPWPVRRVPARPLIEALHSVADSGNQALLPGRPARREPRLNTRFGHDRVRYFAAFLMALEVLLPGSSFLLYEDDPKLRHPASRSTSVNLAIERWRWAPEAQRCVRRSGRPTGCEAVSAGGRSCAPRRSPRWRWCC